MGIFNPEKEQPAPVLASFDTEGVIKPIRVRIMGEAYKILRSSLVSQGYSPVLEYKCAVEANGYERELSVKYYEKDRIWAIPSDIR